MIRCACRQKKEADVLLLNSRTLESRGSGAGSEIRRRFTRSSRRSLANAGASFDPATLQAQPRFHGVVPDNDFGDGRGRAENPHRRLLCQEVRCSVTTGGRMQGLIALEEHMAIEETLGDSKQFMPAVWDQVRSSLLDIHSKRLGLMDKHGIEMMILSLNSPAVQSIPNAKRAAAV